MMIESNFDFLSLTNEEANWGSIVLRVVILYGVLN